MSGRERGYTHRMTSKGLPELHVTDFDVQAGIRHGGLGGEPGPHVPLVALEIGGRSSPDAADESVWLRLTVDVARALATQLIEHADRAEQLARRPGRPSRD